jgi:hypothetical protein
MLVHLIQRSAPAGRSWRLTLIVLATALVLAVAACGGDDDDDDAGEAAAPPEEQTGAEGTPATADDLTGTWLIVEGIEDELMFEFHPDGTYVGDWRGLLATKPGAAGTYEADEGTVRFENGNSDVCRRGDSWAWDSTVSEEGRLDIVFRRSESASEECRVPKGTQWTFVRVSPSSPAGEELRGDPGELEPLTDATTLEGIWLREESGELLSFARNGSYTIDDDGQLGSDPADTGTFELDPEETLTLTSGPKSRTCSRGDRWVWEGSGIEVGPAPEDPTLGGTASWTLVGEVTEDACDHAAGADARWLRISF